MRLAELRLVAFGHFDDAVLDLGAPAPALHIVYGPNEAGKSTALRAITALLYGVPHQTPDAHLHEHAALRVGARLLCVDGTALDLVRRKGRKDTLLGPDGRPAPPAALLRLERALAGVDEALYRRAFGLDQAGLRAGAEALLQDRGDVGKSLFDAALGGRSMHAVLAELEREAAEIYRPRATTATLNQASAAYAVARKNAETAGVAMAAYERQSDELRQLEAQRAELAVRKRRLVVEALRVERLKRLVPPVAKYRKLQAERSALGPVAPLPADATTRRVSADQECTSCRSQREKIEAALHSLEAERASTDVSEVLLALGAATAETIAERLGRHRAAAHDLPKRRSELVTAEHSARAVLRRLGCREELTGAGGLELDAPTVTRLRALAKERGALETDLAQWERTRREERERGRSLTVRHEALGAEREIGGLVAALVAAREGGDVDARLARLEAELASLAARGAQRLAALGAPVGPSSPAEEVLRIASLAVPSRAAVDAAAERLQRLGEEARRLGDHARALDAEARRIARGRSKLAESGEVPLETRLVELRCERDALLRAARIGEAVEDGTRKKQSSRTAEARSSFPGWQTVERAVVEADAYADRLRREADRVAALLALDAAAHAEAEDRTALLADADQHAQQHAACDEAWRALWASSGQPAGEPGAKRGWLDRHAELVRLADEMVQRRSERDGLRRWVAGVKADLEAALEGLGVTCGPEEPLARVVARASALEQELRQTSARRAALDEELAASERRLSVLESEQTEREAQRDALIARWTSAMARIDLPADASIEEMTAVVDLRTELARHLDAVRDRRARVEGIERDADAFTAEVRELAARHAPDLAEREAAATGHELCRGYERAVRGAEERERIDREIERRRRELEELVVRERTAERELSGLLEVAGVTTVADLEHEERRSALARELERRVDEAARAVFDAADGASVEEACAEAAHEDLAIVRQRDAELEDEKDQCDADIVSVTGEAAAKRAGLAAYERETGAAEIANEAQQWLATTERLAARYLRVRLGALVLGQEVERYRRENQGPVLERAGKLFPRLTQGSLAGIEIDYGDDDRAKLVCRRADGRSVPVDGLSDGTRDQLYLALRLATLESWAERSEPLPVVLDDVLLHFDDDRARAALETLAAFSAHMQVLFFTHHARLRDFGRELAADARFVGRVFETSLPERHHR